MEAKNFLFSFFHCSISRHVLFLKQLIRFDSVSHLTATVAKRFNRLNLWKTKMVRKLYQNYISLHCLYSTNFECIIFIMKLEARASVLMELIVDKLSLLDYEDRFCNSRFSRFLSLSLVSFEYKFLFNEVDDFIYLSIFFFIERDVLISNPRFWSSSQYFQFQFYRVNISNSNNHIITHWATFSMFQVPFPLIWCFRNIVNISSFALPHSDCLSSNN